MELVIDSRESALKKCLDAISVVYNSEQLPVGDALLKRVDGETQVICERKTRSDLLSSIKSGRYAEQRERLKETGIKVIYILEGLHEQSFSFGGGSAATKDGNLILGAMENLALYHNIFIIPTMSTEETASLLRNMCKKLSEKSIAEAGAISMVPVQRKDKLMGNIFQQQLTLITGMSLNTAGEIVKLYPTVKSLTEAFTQCKEKCQAELLLADIQCGKRKLGAALSKRVYSVYAE